MIADENHYKSHWEFFQSINPKANELFFVELQINDFEKRIKQGLKEIDFANDVINTPESYGNDLKRKDFFFHKEYKEFLEAKLIELKNKKDLKYLPQLQNSVIVHYGCSDFKSNEHKIFWIGAISHTPNKTYFFENRNEVELIEKFYKYVQDNKEKNFIHWSMNSPKFGFRAIENRYFELANDSINFGIKNEIDLSEYLKNKYGINYIERQNGRLNNLAKLNGFSGIQSDVEVININDATNRLELIFSIVQAEIQRNLKTNTTLPPQQTEKQKPELTINQIVQAEIQGNLRTFQPQPVQETQPPKESDAKYTEAIKKLKSIWLADPKLTVEVFLQKGNDKAFWNDDLQLTLQRSVSTYGTGKTFLANIFIAFKNWAIPEHLDYKEAGKVFCEVFNINVKESTKEKYKVFISGNPKQIREVKRTFGV